MAAVGTWPQITTIGTESAAQSRTGVTVLVAPGPEVTMAHADAAARARVARGHEARALLVGRHDQRHRLAAGAGLFLVPAEHRVVGRQDRPAAVAEDGVDALVGEHLHDDLGAGHGLAGSGVRGVARGGVAVFHGEILLGAEALAFMLRCNRD